MSAYLTEEQKSKYIAKMAEILADLRKQANISQGDFANIIGMSRQNYSNIERGKAPLSWGTYLSLLFYFDNNALTHQLIRTSDAFPHELMYELRAGSDSNSFFMDKMRNIPDEILMSLDDAAWHSLETVAMLEYARCKKMSGDAVIKSFNGSHYVEPTKSKKEVAESIRRLKERNHNCE